MTDSAARDRGRKVSDYQYLVRFSSSFLFHMEALYPLRYLIEDEYEENGPNPIWNLLVLLKRVRDNLRQLAEGEGQEFVKLVAEDTRRHFEIEYEENKGRVKMVERFLEVSERFEDFMKTGRMDKFIEEVKKLGMRQ